MKIIATIVIGLNEEVEIRADNFEEFESNYKRVKALLFGKPKEKLIPLREMGKGEKE